MKRIEYCGKEVTKRQYDFLLNLEDECGWFKFDMSDKHVKDFIDGIDIKDLIEKISYV